MKDPNWRKCILQADSRDIIKMIPDNSIDFILTDPPYNLGQHSTGNIPLIGRSAMNNDVAEWDMIDFNPEEWADEFIRILKPTGNLFIFTSYNQIGRWYDCLDHKFDTTNFMIWHKTNPAPKIYKAGFLNSCEMIFTCWNKGHTWNFISQAEMHNFIESPICMRPERLSDPKHPTQKPISILKKMIDIASNKNDIIFDPFMGVGSTGVAAIELGRRFIGVELDKNYFLAAKNRLDKTLSGRNQLITNISSCDISKEEYPTLNESTTPYQSSIFEIRRFFDYDKFPVITKEQSFKYTGLSPIIKWPGGKEKELKNILPNVPTFDRYFEPFVGGGSVFMAIQAKEYYINDFSTELISLYRSIATSDNNFFKHAQLIDATWKNAELFFHSNSSLIDLYIKYREQHISKEELKSHIHSFCIDKQSDILNIIGDFFASLPCVLLKEIETNLYRKMVRMHDLEIKKHILSDADVKDNIETAIKSAVYMNYRELYNIKDRHIIDSTLHTAIFLFIRNYAYSGMFRYSSKGAFNVPYGGIAYNNKLMAKKIHYYKSEELLNHFATTNIYNLDFEEFLRETKPTKDDFIFLDPPYDSEFSTYAQNTFTHADQERLANYMINECRAKWMMIIKFTDFIFNLYNKKGINIKSFDKEYIVSFMNRNEKKATHLLITNY